MVRHAASNDLISFCFAVNPRYEANWHHKSIAKELHNVAENGDKDFKVLLLEVPPRHGKSELATINFPAWVLGRNPDAEIITASYSGELAQDFGTKTRTIVQSPEYQGIFDTRLKEDEQSKAKWTTATIKDGKTKPAKGSYTSVGVGGPITGRGANICFPAGTLVRTIDGEVPIEDCKYGTRVLSYNHDKSTFEWKKIQATSSRIAKGLTEITSTQGNRVTATHNHPFFVPGKGYVAAERLRKKERVGVFKVREERNTQMHTLWSRVFSRLVRIYKESKEGVYRFVLFFGVLRKTSFFQKPEKVYNLRKPSGEKGQEVLFKEMQAIAEDTKRYTVQVLYKLIFASHFIYQVLFNGVQRQFSFAVSYGEEKPKLETREWNGQISGRVSQNEAENQKKRRGLCYMWNKENIGNSSQRLQPAQQLRRKLSNCLSQASHGASQIKEDTISATTTLNEESVVYDIQVEDNHNFFANDFLVHNCIVDDPLKNREEAESQVYRDKIWDWFTSTLFTRLEPNGVVVLIQTRWHLDDLAGRILEHEELSQRTRVVKFPAFAEEDEEHRSQGEPLWVEKYDTDALNEIKNTIGVYDWTALYQQNPVHSETQEFTKDMFRYRTEEEIEAKRYNRYLTVDTAVSEKDTDDATGFCDNRVDTENKWNIKAWRERYDPKQLIDALFTLHENNHYVSIGIEKTVFTQAIQPFLEDEMRKRNKFLPVVQLSHKQTQKEIRIRGLLPRYASKSIFHIDNDCSDLEEEALTFPKGASDDVIDATAYQLQVAQPPNSDELEMVIQRNRSKKKQNPAR